MAINFSLFISQTAICLLDSVASSATFALCKFLGYRYVTLQGNGHNVRNILYLNIELQKLNTPR